MNRGDGEGEVERQVVPAGEHSSGRSIEGNRSVGVRIEWVS